MKNILNYFMCIFFHPIEIIEKTFFIDRVSKKSVGKFKCRKCNKKYLANDKRNFYRQYI